MEPSQKYKHKNTNFSIKKKYTCYIYGEGRTDTNFIKALRSLDKFKYHTQNWVFNDGNASGSSAKTILSKCRRSISTYSYDLVLCFIDQDDLKHDYPTTWHKEKVALTKKYSEITIIWQINNLEDEYKKVIGNQFRGKYKINSVAKKNIDKFINSSYWKRILKPIKNREKELE